MESDRKITRVDSKLANPKLVTEEMVRAMKTSFAAEGKLESTETLRAKKKNMYQNYSDCFFGESMIQWIARQQAISEDQAKQYAAKLLVSKRETRNLSDISNRARATSLHLIRRTLKSSRTRTCTGSWCVRTHQRSTRLQTLIQTASFQTIFQLSVNSLRSNSVSPHAPARPRTPPA